MSEAHSDPSPTYFLKRSLAPWSWQHRAQATEAVPHKVTAAFLLYVPHHKEDKMVLQWKRLSSSNYRQAKVTVSNSKFITRH